VARILSSSLSRRLLVCAALSTLPPAVSIACGGSEPPLKTQAAASDSSSAARRPDGIVIDLPHALPAAADRAEARGVVALREPLPRDAMIAVVRAWVDGFMKEDLDALRSLLASDAAWLWPPPAGGPMPNIVEQWATRLRNYDYGKLAGAEIFRADKIDILNYEEAKDVRPTWMRTDDVLVTVPIQTPRVGTDALFPEKVTLLLRREKGRYIIGGVFEDFAP
jgi:hypothetical protein